MATIVDILNGGDPIALIALIVILCFVGGKMVVAESRVHSWGLRLAALAFVAYGAYACIAFRPTDAGQLVWFAFRALLASGLMLGTSWVLLPILAFVYQGPIGGGLGKIQSWWNTAGEKAAERKARQEAEERERQRQHEYEQQAPARERAQQDQAAKAAAEARDRRRREDARASCELLYVLYAPDIGQRFTKEMLDDFAKRHLGDDHDADYVEQRASQLQAVLQQHYEHVHPTPKFKDMVELARWFEEQKRQLDTLPIDERAKRAHLANLNRRLHELMTEHLEHSGP